MEHTPPTSSSTALTTTLLNSIQALGRGFDVTNDIRLLYCKGAPGSRLIQFDEAHTQDLVVSDAYIPNVSKDVDCSKGKSSRETTPVCSFQEDMVSSELQILRTVLHLKCIEDSGCGPQPHPDEYRSSLSSPLQMAEHFNKKSGIPGRIPLGSFNAMFNFTGSWQVDMAATKSLAMDGYFIPLFKVHLVKHQLYLNEDIKRAVPYSWDPSALASFIENFGTHIITSATVGGRDVVYVKQHHSSPLSSSEIEKYVKDIGNQRFLDVESQVTGPSNSQSQEIHPQISSVPYLSGKEDVTVIFRRRGGDDLVQSHAKWTDTVHLAPDVINMTFCPIVSLLEGVSGLKHLSSAIDLYLEYKPPVEELQYFLEFQIPRVWAPNQSSLPGHQRKEPVSPSLQCSLMGPKLYVSADQVTVGRKPVTGLRLCLEGSKQNRLAIHLQHLASLPKILHPHWDSHMAIGAPKWHGAEEQDSRWFEPIKWKNFSHVSTAPIELTETNIGDLSGVHIVTGAQLGVWDFGAKSVLHLKLLFSKVPGCTIRRSVWDHSPANISHMQKPESSDDKKADSSSQISKFAKIIDSTEMSKGPRDIPGHWLVTGAKLGVEKGKIVLRVKYSLLNY